MDPTKPSEDQTQATTASTTDEPVAETPVEPEPAGGIPGAPVADTPVPVQTPVSGPAPATEEPEPPAGDATTPPATSPSKEEDGTDTSGSAGMGGATV